MVYESDALVAFGDGKITLYGPAAKVEAELPGFEEAEQLELRSQRARFS